MTMPDNIEVHNGSHERCDMADGPCSCGSWHNIEDWPDEIRVEIERQSKL